MKSLESLALYGRARAMEATILPPLPVLDGTASSDLRVAGTSQEGQMGVDNPERNSAVNEIVANWAEEPIVI